MSKLKNPIVLAVALAAIAPSANAATKSSAQEKAAIQQEALTQKNKALVMKAYQELFGDHDLTALDRYWTENYIQHNPTMTDGRESVKQLLENMGITHWPKQKVDYKRVIAEGDLVMLQVAQPKTENSPEMVIVDIFRIENGKIVEHWDVMQPVPANSANQRSMY